MTYDLLTKSKEELIESIKQLAIEPFWFDNVETKTGAINPVWSEKIEQLAIQECLDRDSNWWFKYDEYKDEFEFIDLKSSKDELNALEYVPPEERNDNDIEGIEEYENDKIAVFYIEVNLQEIWEVWDIYNKKESEKEVNSWYYLYLIIDQNGEIEFKDA